MYVSIRQPRWFEAWKEMNRQMFNERVGADVKRDLEKIDKMPGGDEKKPESKIQFREAYDIARNRFEATIANLRNPSVR